jgi:hypothetical protein
VLGQPSVDLDLTVVVGGGWAVASSTAWPTRTGRVHARIVRWWEPVRGEARLPRQADRHAPGESLGRSCHPEREPGELLFVADLTGELRAWPQDSWAKLGVDPDQVAQAVIGCWQDGEVSGLQVDDLDFEEARSLTWPAMTYVRGRLSAQLARVHRRWLHPTSGRRPDDRFL